MHFLILAAAAGFALPATQTADAAYILDRLGVHAPTTAADLRVYSNPDGQVLACEVRRYVGSETVADRMCQLMMTRKIKAARSFDGEPAYGVTNLIATISDESINDKLLKRLGTSHREGIILTVNRLPEDGKGKRVTSFLLGLEIGPSGEVVNCGVNRDVPANVVAVACDEARSGEYPALRIGDDPPVPYVLGLQVELEQKSV